VTMTQEYPLITDDYLSIANHGCLRVRGPPSPHFSIRALISGVTSASRNHSRVLDHRIRNQKFFVASSRHATKRRAAVIIGNPRKNLRDLPVPHRSLPPSLPPAVPSS